MAELKHTHEEEIKDLQNSMNSLVARISAYHKALGAELGVVDNWAIDGGKRLRFDFGVACIWLTLPDIDPEWWIYWKRRSFTFFLSSSFLHPDVVGCGSFVPLFFFFVFSFCCILCMLWWMFLYFWPFSFPTLYNYKAGNKKWTRFCFLRACDILLPFSVYFVGNLMFGCECEIDSM